VSDDSGEAEEGDESWSESAEESEEEH